MSLIENIKEKKNLSHVEKNIADYILLHRDQIKNMTITTLANETYTSNAAIIRFCRKVGAHGYKDFKINFIQELEKNRNNETYVDYNYPFRMDENTNDILNNIANLTKSTIDTIYKNSDVKMIEDIAKVITNSQNVYFYAVGDSLIRAMSFQNKLLKIGKNIINTSSLRDETSYTTLATKKDCGLFISYSGSSYAHLANAQILKKQNIPIIVISANDSSPLVKIADYPFLIPSKEDKFDSIATFYSQIAFEYILNVLYSLIYNIQYTKSHQIKNNITKNSLRFKKIDS